MSTVEARKENGEKAGGQEGEGQGQGEEEEERTPSTVMVTGAVEMKGIVGSDARSYLLDVSRLTPRDANWVRGEKGTGVYKKWLEVMKKFVVCFLAVCVASHRRDIGELIRFRSPPTLVLFSGVVRWLLPQLVQIVVENDSRFWCRLGHDPWRVMRSVGWGGN